ncbi:MAG: hypothetical protein MUE36_12260 [Acidimicrobiales bacterium]|nr:hypothetical protein [Acidimicrobiales bacterium]
MATIWRRVPAAADWAVAVVAGIALYALNVTDQGGPLDGAGLSAGPTTAGITEGGRVTFYGALAIVGAVLAMGGLLITIAGPGWRSAGLLASRSFGGLAAAGLAGLLLDYRDGPVSLIRSVVYVLLVLSVVRFVRVSIMLASLSDEETLRA